MNRDSQSGTLSHKNAAEELRLRCRRGEHRSPTPGFAPGFEQANLVIIPKEYAHDFRLFCELNPRPCPLIEMTEPGNPEPAKTTPGADLRTDLPLYRVYEFGKLTSEPTDIRTLWRDDFVSFLLGCSFSFESALETAHLPVRHLHESIQNGTPKNVPMYQTNLPCKSAGRFESKLVVSMRPYRPADVPKVSAITARFPLSHGAPVHQGDPSKIGIADLHRPEWGDAVTINPDEVPVFWACGVTSQAALLSAKLPLAITHAPGHMFVTDVQSGSEYSDMVTICRSEDVKDAD